MKLVTFVVETPLGPQARLGALAAGDPGPWILDLNAAYGYQLAGQETPERAAALADLIVPPDALRLLEGGPASLQAARETLQFARVKGLLTDGLVGVRGERLAYRADQIRLLAPVPRPASIRDGYSFERHVRAGRRRRGFEDVAPEWYERPVYYKGNVRTVIGPDEPIWWPAFTEKLDYELEIGIFIGMGGRNIPKERAAEHIAGFAIFNDVSARDIQVREMAVALGPAKSKDFDHGNVIGPYLVTADEVPDPRALTAITRVNGEVWSETDTSDMYWSWEDLIAYISRDETLYPGDFIGGGTLANGCGADLGRWLQVGDVIELEVSGLGVLRNPIVPTPGQWAVGSRQ